MLNWTSKGRQLDLKRASIASQLGVFSKPRDHVLALNCMKIVYKRWLEWDKLFVEDGTTWYLFAFSAFLFCALSSFVRPSDFG